MTPAVSTKKLRDLVFEIGTEELPATNLADLFENSIAEKIENPLLVKWKESFDQHRITFGSAAVWATPRRLVFHLTAVAPTQEKKDLLTRLMGEAEAYAAGKPTEKLLTILKHRNVLLEDTIVSDFNGKPNIFIKKAEPVRKTATVLPELLESFVKSLSFPKNMKWDDGGLFFPRPIRHTLCFFGNDPVKFRLGKTRSSEKVWFFSKGKRSGVTVSDVDTYFRALKKQGVILDSAERKKSIENILEQLAKSNQGRLYEDPTLLNEVNYLVEQPEGLSAPFHADFLNLPLEVLTVSMARKQRIFGLVDGRGQVLPKFLAILDGKTNEKEKKMISKNYENILHAKLQDSLFFYREDLKAPLAAKRDELKNLIFLKGAGSMYDKSERLVRLSRKLSAALSLSPEEGKALERAATLSKCDLLTQMVGEFPELQGVIGKYYALENKENRAAALAIGEHYLPRTASDKLPETDLGALLSLMDKCDLVSACFGLNLEPSSSLDPYGQRRSVTAVLKIILDRKLNLSMEALLGDCLKELSSYLTVDAEKLREKLMSFFKDRFKALMVDRGFREDLVDAAMAARFEKPTETWQRVEALSKLFLKNEFSHACKVVERTHNILKGNREILPARPDKALYVEALEHALHEKLEQHEGAILNAKKSSDFPRATSLYAEAFFDILNEFFDKVFINADDLNVRKNRLSLLKVIKELYTSDIADLSKIQLHSGA